MAVPMAWNCPLRVDMAAASRVMRKSVPNQAGRDFFMYTGKMLSTTPPAATIARLPLAVGLCSLPLWMSISSPGLMFLSSSLSLAMFFSSALTIFLPGQTSRTAPEYSQYSIPWGFLTK